MESSETNVDASHAKASESTHPVAILPARPRPADDETLRTKWCGDQDPVDPWPALDLVFSRCSEILANTQSSVQDRAARATRESSPAHAEIAQMASSLLADVAGQTNVIRFGDASSVLRVVLMGRTQAGKSTLLAALSGEHSRRIGDGRQRFSRTIQVSPVRELSGIEIVDTPGVGARDGAEDQAVAFEQLPPADLVMWVASNNSVQEETAVALRTIGAMGKPVLVVLNCKWRLDDELGLVEFLEDPDVAFRDTQGDLNAIARQLAKAGATSVRTILVHADAAFRSTRDSSESALLAEHSRIGDLYEALKTEVNSRADQRRLLRTIDTWRTPTSAYLAELGSAREELLGRVTASRGVVADLQQRSVRDIERHAEQLQTRLFHLVDARRTWHVDASVDQGLEKRWKGAMEKLQAEVEKSVAKNHQQLTAALQQTNWQVTQDWNALNMDQFELGDFHGFGSMWKNRVGRASVTVASGLASAAAGAKVGALLGIEGGPPLMAVTGAVGAVVGFGLSFVVRPINDAINGAFRGKAWVLKHRREQLARKIHPVLDKIADELKQAMSNSQTAQLESLNRAFAAIENAMTEQEAVAEHWRTEGDRLESAVGTLDRQTVRGLLSMTSRHQLATQVQSASRSPGVAIAAEFNAEGFFEAALFQAVGVCEPITACGPAKDGLPAGQALPLVLGLCRGRIAVTGLKASAASLLLLDDDLPQGILDTWVDLLSAHTSSRIQITRPSGGLL